MKGQSDESQAGLSFWSHRVLEAVKAISVIAHHLADLRDIAELLGQFQHTHLLRFTTIYWLR